MCNTSNQMAEISFILGILNEYSPIAVSRLHLILALLLVRVVRIRSIWLVVIGNGIA